MKNIYRIAFWISVLGLIVFIFDFGFPQDDGVQKVLNGFYYIFLGVGVLAIVARYIGNRQLLKRKVFILDLIFTAYTLLIYFIFLFYGTKFLEYSSITRPIWLKIAIIFFFIREASEIRINYKRTFLNPAQLFVLSFLMVILLGSFLLKLPNSTNNGISFVDAFFTATSAVCVTGLIVVDTGTYFTLFGQIVILSLIQIGGLGILTFASYFSYFFKGGSSYENRIALGDMTNSKMLGEVFSTLKYIILITIGIESVSALLVYLSLDPGIFPSIFHQIFFSIFHAISAFCNAGFSTMSNNLMEEGLKFNYFLQLMIVSTFVLGGLGFPIVSNLINYIKYRLKKMFPINHKIIEYRPWILNLNSRITLITTFTVSLIAFLLFYVLEYNNTLSEHHGFGKAVTALFGATTPRTAGFNTIDSASMLFPTTILVILLMWIGASPASTGGGIKTSTFAIAILNSLSLAKGKTRIEIYRREIADISVRRAFAIIFLSLIVIGAGTISIAMLHPELDFLDIAFECFSAYSTVGLSLGITAKLSTAAKLILTAIMFIGRVSVLTFIIAVFKKIKHNNYRYPTEEITIN